MNATIRSFAICYLLLAILPVSAQTLTTNLVPAASSYRDVDGKLYNADLSVLWKTVEGKITQVLTNAIVLSGEKTVYETHSLGPGPLTANQSVGGYAPPVSSVTREKQVPTHRVYFITNYPIALWPSLDKRVSVRAFPLGKIRYGDRTLEFLDYGLPHMVLLVTTNKPARTNSIAGTQK